MILKVNGLPANFITLGSLTRRLEGRKGKKIRLRIARGTLQVRKSFAWKNCSDKKNGTRPKDGYRTVKISNVLKFHKG